MDWYSVLIGAVIGIISTLVGGIFFELFKNFIEKKGKIEIYYMSDCECYGGSKIIIRLQIKNLTKSEYIMRDISLVEIDKNNIISEKFCQKQKIEQPLKGLLITLPKIYGEDGEFSFLIKQKCIQSMSLIYDKKQNVDNKKIEMLKGDEIEYETVEYNEIKNNLVLQYYDEKDKLVAIKITPKQIEWKKVKTIKR